MRAETTGELGADEASDALSCSGTGAIGADPALKLELELPGLDFSGFFLPNEKLFLFRSPNVFEELLRLETEASLFRSSWSRLSRRSRSLGSVSDISVSDSTTALVKDVCELEWTSGGGASLLEEPFPGRSLAAIALKRSRCRCQLFRLALTNRQEFNSSLFWVSGCHSSG